MSNDLSDEVIVVIYSATLPIDMDMILTTMWQLQMWNLGAY